jgi:hypothetical protein
MHGAGSINHAGMIKIAFGCFSVVFSLSWVGRVEVSWDRYSLCIYKSTLTGVWLVLYSWPAGSGAYARSIS